MLAVIDNGKGAEEIARSVRGKVVAPNKIPNASAYVLSDGILSKENQKANLEFIKKLDKPLLAIGLGCSFLGSVYGATIKELKSEQKQERLSVVKPCPLVLDLKKFFTVLKSCKYTINELPDNFGIIASSSSCEFEIIQEFEKPFFGVQFNPELGMEGRKILDNFAKFVDVWEKYHK